jgi:hypothetical protein
MPETDYRALCEQLMEFAEGKRYDGCAVIQRARAALAQPEPVAPTDEELEKLADDYMAMDGATGVMCLGHLDFARAALARWGTPANNTGGTH